MSMIDIKNFLSKNKTNAAGQKTLGRCNYFVLNILIAIPLIIIAHQNLIELNWPFNLDRILLFIILIIVIQLVKTFKNYYYICTLVYLFNNFFGYSNR
jgi:hypothetical protein